MVLIRSGGRGFIVRRGTSFGGFRAQGLALDNPERDLLQR